jgi:hypothetical protein
MRLRVDASYTSYMLRERRSDHQYIFESDGKYYNWLPETEDFFLLNNAQSDEAAIKVWLSPFETTRVVELEDGYKELDELEDNQVMLARNRIKYGNALTV